MTADAESLGLTLTNLDDPLFDGADATKRDLIEYLDSVADRMVPVLEDRPLSVIRIHRGHESFMQKNLPSYAPPWIPRVTLWAESSKRDVTYALCNDRRTLLWFANQRSIEYHPALVRMDKPDRMTHLVLDIDPPSASAFAEAVRAARVVRQVLLDLGLTAALKTSGAKGLHLFVPIKSDVTLDDAAAATRAIERACGAAGSGHGHERVHQGRARRQGLRRCDAGRRRDRRRRIQPADSTRSAGVISSRLGRAR